ncbi:MAG: phosphoadenylyl-sulfate reductase [Bacteroidota bacterium]
MKERINQLNEQLRDASAEEVLECVIKQFNGKICFASSMGAEDQVLTAMIAAINPATHIFTLDTGRLFNTTLSLIGNTRERFNVRIDVLFPEAAAVEKMVNEKGVNLFYESVENRKLCCNIRKVVQVRRALVGMDAWISGLRREQSVTRAHMNIVEWDEEFGLVKINPLISWTEEQVWEYIRKNNIPYNPLHDNGFRSIGCQPCTRAVKPGDDLRSGRWWWEDADKKECGLHEFRKSEDSHPA